MVAGCCSCFVGLTSGRRKPSPHVGVIGELFVDVQAQVAELPHWNDDVETDAVNVFPGGCGANTARQLDKLVKSVTFFSTHGQDLLGRIVLEHMRSQNFDISHVHPVPVPSSTCLVLTGPSDRAFVSCYSSIERMRMELLDQDALLACDHVHIAGYFGLRGLQTDEFIALLQRCKRNGATLSLGTNADPSGKWTGANGHFRRVLLLADVFIANDREVAEVEKALGSSLREVVSNLSVVTTCGEAGARVAAPGVADSLVPACAVSKVEDLTGAGDAFVAGFLSSWVADVGPAAQRNVFEAVRWGNASASCVVQRKGACSEPVPLEEVQAAYASCKECVLT